jgi:hypothetical protein
MNNDKVTALHAQLVAARSVDPCTLSKEEKLKAEENILALWRAYDEAKRAQENYEPLADEIDAILSAAWELKSELTQLRNPNSYLDTRILFQEFFPEIEAAQETREEQALLKYGWTRVEFDAEVTRRI